MISKYIISVISFYCSFYEDPHQCKEHMEICIPIEQAEYPDYPIDGILENCIESYEDWKYFMQDGE